MKNIYIFLYFFAFTILGLNAQYICDFEDCETQGYSECFANPYGWDTPTCSTDQNHTPGGSYSGLISDDGTTDAILDLGNKIFGTWGIEFWMYVPTNKEAYWNIQGQVPVVSGEWVVGNFFFNQDLGSPGVGYIDMGTTTTNDDYVFSFPHDEWFQIVINVYILTGIATATWQFGVAGVEVVPGGTAFADGNANRPSALGGIDFFSIHAGTNILYLDDITLKNSFFIIGITEIESKGFSIFPNPFKDELHIKANEAITKISIFNLLGEVTYRKNINKKTFTIDTSNLTYGTYIIKVTIGNTIGYLKIIK